MTRSHGKESEMKQICITIKTWDEISADLEAVLAKLSDRLIPEELLYLSA